MPIYKATSINLDHPDWQASTQKGVFRVHALTEASALDLLHNEFRKAEERSPDGPFPKSPWQHEGLVRIEVDPDASPGDYRDGQIEPLETWGGGGVMMGFSPGSRSALAAAREDEEAAAEAAEAARYAAEEAAQIAAEEASEIAAEEARGRAREEAREAARYAEDAEPERPEEDVGAAAIERRAWEREQAARDVAEEAYERTLERAAEEEREKPLDEERERERAQAAEEATQEANGEAVEDAEAKEEGGRGRTVNLAGTASSTSTAQADLIVEHPPITQATVRRVVANRVVLTYQSSALLEFLDALMGPENVPVDQRNSPSLAMALGVSDALAVGELLEVLKDLSGELRRFNDALESAKLDRAELERLKETGLKALGSFTQTVAIGSGGLFLAALGGLLDQAGLVPWIRFIELLKSLRGG